MYIYWYVKHIYDNIVSEDGVRVVGFVSVNPFFSVKRACVCGC